MARSSALYNLLPFSSCHLLSIICHLLPLSYRFLKHINVYILYRFELYAVPRNACLAEFFTIRLS